MRYAALIAALMLAGYAAVAQTPPPIWYDLESDFQQVQELPDQDFVQGAGVVLRYRIKSQGRWLSLAGLGARWDGRSSSTSTQALQAAASVVTNVTPNYFQITLNSTQTGSAVTNWVYSLIVTLSGTDYPIGVGSLDIAASTWTGAAAVLSNVTAAAYTDAAVAAHAAVKATTNSLGHVIVGAGLSVDGNGVISNPQSVPTWDDVTGKPTTFAPLLNNTQNVIRASTSAGLGIYSMSDGEVVTLGAGNTQNAAFLGGVSVAGTLAVGGTNIITELAAKVAKADTNGWTVASHDGLYSASNPSNFVNGAGAVAAVKADADWQTATNQAANALLRTGGTRTGIAPIAVQDGSSYEAILLNKEGTISAADFYYNLGEIGVLLVTSGYAIDVYAGASRFKSVEASSYALTDNKQADAAATQIGTNATYAISYAGGLYQTFGFTATNDLTLTLTAPAAGNRAFTEVTFTNYTYRAVTWPTNNAVWINTAPTGSWASVGIDWRDVNGTIKAALINTSVTGQ